MTKTDKREFFRKYDLVKARKHPSHKSPAGHQNRALAKLDRWYDSKPSPDAGGILVLPTGGGKTFTVIRFLCHGPISDGYKILWLAHTHHLLEQAFEEFGESVSLIAEPTRELTTRVVSGTPGHYPIHRIRPSDDVLVGTLQTISNGYKNRHPALMKFLDAAEGKLCVVFDEAHHSPAPSYRRLVFDLRERCGEMLLLGLTATPTRTEEDKRGWLIKLFPQGIVHQVTPQRLMALGILAKPILEEPRTSYTPEFDEREYRTWVGMHRELPEHIITQLALNQERNLYIANYYVQHKEKYGKTLIFADRWYQCEQLSEFLRSRGVRTGAMYSHVDADPGSVEARNKRNKDENTAVLEKFRNGELDVLLNVRMLTEGTDIPDVNTVFLTRATTSQILLTQMIGRALRGPKFGGTENAYIVSFTDNWKQLINWAEYDQLVEGPTGGPVPPLGKRPPLQLISIALVQRLARQMDSGVPMTPGPFLSLLPAGWYRVEYRSQVEDSEDLEPVRELVMVFEHEKSNYRAFVDCVAGERLEDFEEQSLRLDSVRNQIDAWRDNFFPEREQHYGTNLDDDLFKIVRHIAQNGSVPRFFKFEERERHNLDAIAQEFIDKGVGRREENAALRQEYNRVDRLWSTIYPRYDLLKCQYDACVNRILRAGDHGVSPNTFRPGITEIPTEEVLIGEEPSEHVKLQVKERDQFCCQCCSSLSRRSLQVDHISAHYYSGSNALDNLQTLCGTCNRLKGTRFINFRDPETDLNNPSPSLPQFKMPSGRKAGDPDQWVMFLCRTFNFFYQCGAVHVVGIGKRGKLFYNWYVELKTGNNPAWLEPFLPDLLDRIRRTRAKAKFGVPNTITITSPGKKEVTYSQSQKSVTTQTKLP